ncbi:hypothetical protein NL108_018113 [Boleophthalmus pectinirostris]|uniref:butyrophilin subfamily 2 member A1-like n=1 Tax=Boleophthalmus pectinirostris TaxID=150288 RepID=UPI000A1C4577|nr:butyrophilin subfamily 2 member A1-like [Boleophthalmus pectinirostris]KAJ0056036.1 hypothetical protein NL108_018113 [Boleophthalmus pectinirostris]
MSASFILCLWIVSVCLSPLVRAQTRLIGEPQPVLASTGDDVVLPCRCDPPLNLAPLTVEWSRTELKPHPSDPLKIVPFVHVYTEWHEDTDMKIPEFVNRTQLFPEQFREGVASLRIRRVALSDNGTYKCFVPNLRREAFVTLIVRSPEEVFLNDTENETKPELDNIDPFPTSVRSRLAIIISFVLVIGVVAVVVFVVMKKRICKRQKRDVEYQPESTDRSEDRPEGQNLLKTELPVDDSMNESRKGG